MIYITWKTTVYKEMFPNPKAFKTFQIYQYLTSGSYNLNTKEIPMHFPKIFSFKKFMETRY